MSCKLNYGSTWFNLPQVIQKPWFNLPQVIQIVSFCLFNLITAVFIHCELRHNFTKQMPRITKRKTNHASISEDVMTAFSDEMEMI